MTIFKRIDLYLGDMGPWYFAGLMAILFVLLIVYAKTGSLW